MRKIQCEVCGSSSIIVNDDDLFECQHCGVQYSRDKLRKMLVEIDHSPEVTNFIKRGESFEKAGDVAIAKEYYNKALDLDIDNEIARNAIARVEIN